MNVKDYENPVLDYKVSYYISSWRHQCLNEQQCLQAHWWCLNTRGLLSLLEKLEQSQFIIKSLHSRQLVLDFNYHMK